MNRAESALATTMRLAEVAAEEKRLGRIVAAANMCNAGGEVYDADYGGYMRVSHLAAYLRAWNTERAEIRRLARVGDGGLGEPDPDEWSAMHDCPICGPAYAAIQDRKDVRRRRGALRAALVRIGKLALKEANP